MCKNIRVHPLGLKYVHLLNGVVRDDTVDYAWVFVCALYGIGKKDVRDIDDARHRLFVKVKRDLDVLPPTHGTERFKQKAKEESFILLVVWRRRK